MAMPTHMPMDGPCSPPLNGADAAAGMSGAGPPTLGLGRHGQVVAGTYERVPVAVKMLHPSMLRTGHGGAGEDGAGGGRPGPHGDSSDALRLMQEVRVLSRCRHPNIVTIVGAGGMTPQGTTRLLSQGGVEAWRDGGMEGSVAVTHGSESAHAPFLVMELMSCSLAELMECHRTRTAAGEGAGAEGSALPLPLAALTMQALAAAMQAGSSASGDTAAPHAAAAGGGLMGLPIAPARLLKQASTCTGPLPSREADGLLAAASALRPPHNTADSGMQPSSGMGGGLSFPAASQCAPKEEEEAAAGAEALPACLPPPPAAPCANRQGQGGLPLGQVSHMQCVWWCVWQPACWSADYGRSAAMRMQHADCRL